MAGAEHPPSDALVVVDVQNAFCHPEGSFARMGHDVTACRGAVAGCRQLVEAARDHGVPVFFVVYGYQAGYADGGYLVARIHPEVREHEALLAGTWDCQVVDELAPRDGEDVVVKNRYSAFLGTDLAERARARGVTSMTFCGVTTNICVEGSARDAAQLDFGVTVVADACGEMDAARHTASLATIAHGFGTVTDVDHVRAAWTTARSTRQDRA